KKNISAFWRIFPDRSRQLFASPNNNSKNRTKFSLVWPKSNLFPEIPYVDKPHLVRAFSSYPFLELRPSYKLELVKWG
ncbi:MAG: hypothetical protein RIC03_08055, partial [Cyclobacteriaceae bacterium]